MNVSKSMIVSIMSKSLHGKSLCMMFKEMCCMFGSVNVSSMMKSKRVSLSSMSLHDESLFV